MVKKIIVALSVILIIVAATMLYFRFNGTDPEPNPDVKTFDTNWKERVFGSKDYYEIDVYDRDGITEIGKFRIDK
ncbi:MAG: hypothetical protein IJZ07_08270 [Clostridia bacterium]|nr:hypothetical protein [Clostridia bacterium]